MIVTIDAVRKKCTEGRYFTYNSLQERLFVSVAIYIVWFCIRLGISGNTVSWLSALVAVLGAFLLTSENSLVVFIGSFGYILWYLLDFVDGAVARFNGKGGVSGQYADWIMHVIAHVAVVAGISIGAMNSVGSWIYPFAILGTVAACLAYAKFSMAWFAICMEQQQRRAKGLDVLIEKKEKTIAPTDWFGFKKYIRGLSIIIFHENFLILSLPVIAAFEFFHEFEFVDLRVIFTVAAGGLYLPVQILEIGRMISLKKVENGYKELFSENHIPNLPNDHFLK